VEALKNGIWRVKLSPARPYVTKCPAEEKLGSGNCLSFQYLHFLFWNSICTALAWLESAVTRVAFSLCGKL
jgi:hypothetical protein